MVARKGLSTLEPFDSSRRSARSRLPDGGADWREQVNRQYARLNADARARIAASVIALGLAWFFIDHITTLVCVVVFILSEALVPAVMGKFQTNPTRLTANLYVLLSFVAASAYTIPPVLLWHTGGIELRLAAICYIFGGFINVFAVNTLYLPMAVSKTIPLSFAALSFPIDLLIEGNFKADALFTLATLVLLTGYSVMLVAETHRANEAFALSRRRLEAMSRAKSAFLSSMSHEIRTPLNSIRGVGQLIPRLLGKPLTDEMTLAVSLLDTAAFMLEASIEDAVALTTMEEVQGGVAMISASPLQALQVVIERLQPSAKECGVPLSFEASATLPAMAGFSPVPFRYALVAALQDVLKFTAKTAPRTGLRVSASVDNSAVAAAPVFSLVLRLAFNGPIDLSRDFEFHSKIRFALELLQASAVFPDDPTAPALVVIVVPLQRVLDGPHPGVPPFVAQSQRARQVLVVDDTAANRFIAAQMCRLDDMAAIEAASGAEALTLLDASAFDVVLLDLNMPGMSGAETLAAIRASSKGWADLPIIAITTDVNGEQRIRCLAEGFSGFVNKPIDQNLLLAEINRTLEPTG